MAEMDKEKIYLDFHEKVLHYLYGKTLDMTLSEDLCSDVFVKIYSKLDTFDSSKASISTWIYTITGNTLTDYFRTRKVYSEIPEEMSDRSNVEEEVCNNETLEILAASLSKLDEREKKIIVLHYYENKKLKDIAEEMGISYPYVKILRNKALQKLKSLME